MPHKFDEQLKKQPLNKDEMKEIQQLMNIICNMIIRRHFIFLNENYNKKYILNPAIFGGKGGRDNITKDLSNDIDVLISNSDDRMQLISQNNKTKTIIHKYISKIINEFNEKYKFVELKISSCKWLNTEYLSTISIIQSLSIINRVVLEYKYNGSILNKYQSLYFNIDFVIINFNPFKFFSHGLFSSDKCLTYDNRTCNIYSDDSSHYDMEINDDVKDIWRKNTKKKITYLTIDWIYKGNNIICHSHNMDADTEEEYEKSVQECNNKKQSSKNKLIASIFKKNMTGWDVANSNIVLMKYRSLTEEQQKSINERVLTPDFKFPFLSKINMNDVVYIIPLNEYMYLQEFYMHACDYYYHDEYDYPFSYTTINIRGNIIPIRTEKWSFELHHTFPKDFREIIDTLFEKHRNTIPEDLWGLILSNIDRFNLPQC